MAREQRSAGLRRQMAASGDLTSVCGRRFVLRRVPLGPVAAGDLAALFEREARIEQRGPGRVFERVRLRRFSLRTPNIVWKATVPIWPSSSRKMGAALDAADPLVGGLEKPRPIDRPGQGGEIRRRRRGRSGTGRIPCSASNRWIIMSSSIVMRASMRCTGVPGGTSPRSWLLKP